MVTLSTTDFHEIHHRKKLPSLSNKRYGRRRKYGHTSATTSILETTKTNQEPLYTFITAVIYK
jgi:hypothetical protein